MSPALKVATRGSQLALAQSRAVASLLGVAAEMVVVETSGDRRPELPISQIGGQGAFVKEVQAAVLGGRADIAVHSAKDLPSSKTPGLLLASVPRRADERDALVGSTLDALEPGALVLTGSVRRRAQLANLRPDLRFEELRGNIGTRLARVPAGGAVVVAMAALDRLGRAGEVAQALDPSLVLPQVGQGALAVECREDDVATRELVGVIDDPGAHSALLAERAFLERLGGGCDLPVGALARARPPGGPGEPTELHVEGLIASLDGRVVLRRSLRGLEQDASAVGSRLAGEMVGEGGGAFLLEDITPGAGVPA